MTTVKQTYEMFLTKEQIIKNTISILATKYNFDKNEAYRIFNIKQKINERYKYFMVQKGSKNR